MVVFAREEEIFRCVGAFLLVLRYQVALLPTLVNYLNMPKVS